MTISEILALDRAHVMNVFGPRLPVRFVRGEGCTLWDQDGRAYTDFIAGIGINVLGYHHPVVTEALTRQIETGILHTSNLSYPQHQAELAAFLCRRSFAGRAFFVNSGSEANETALKLACKFFYQQGRPRRRVISCQRGFHGRTLAAAAATGYAAHHAPFLPFLPQGFVQVPFNDLGALRAALDEQTAAVLVEPIQGQGGVIPADPGYLKGIRAACDEAGALLILDEVQTGIHRTGSFFCHEQYGVVPDILTCGKGMGAGFPIGGVLASERAASAFAPGDHGGTFSGTPLACALSLAVLQFLDKGDFSAQAEEKGRLLSGLLASVPGVKTVRGKGLLLGVLPEKPIPAEALMRRMLARGFLVGKAAGNTLRLAPPLIVTPKEIEAFCAALSDCLREDFD